jgi:GNAT superfamily N-acetyltransferase
MKSRIREYASGDYDACRALWRELTERHRDIYGDASIGGEDPGSGIDAYLANPRRRGSWVAEVQGEVVALAGLMVMDEEAEIEPVVVAARCRSRGIGKTLVEHVVAQAKDMGVAYVSVRPVARNKEAIAFFVAMGFDQLGHIELFQGLSRTHGTKWTARISIHGNEVAY